ncbi:MAG: Multicopper oxidase [Parcubacteria group bacterium Gr01-1014_49]|nr:MAG: Multicopper oxidase [Parcubacteria group bacterium Gr01-1014_49]
MKNKTLILIVAVLAGIAAGGYFIRGFSEKPFVTGSKGLQEARATKVVELRDGDTYDLTASIVRKAIAGNELKMLAYNGSIPGPVLKILKGAEITINFTNDTDVPTTIHSHGVRLDNAFDGVPGVTQKEVGIGESSSYKIRFPDAGIYWYHPHLREDYAQESGLSGNYIVVSDNPNYWSPVNEEVPLMVDDILIENGKIAPFGPVADHTLMGRFGNVMLANGADDYSLSVMQGEVIRFYITNAANTRVFNLAIPGAKMKLVGGDSGKYERESFADSVLLGPSERAIIEVLFDAAGTYTLQHTTPQMTYTMGTIRVSSEKAAPSYKSQFLTLRTNSDTIASIDPFRQYFDKKNDKSIALTVDMGGMGMSGSHQMPGGQMMSNGGMMMGGNDNEKIEWEDSMAMMNAMTDANTIKWKIVDQETGKAMGRASADGAQHDSEKSGVDWQFKVGDTVKVRIYNDPNSAHPMQHPIHFHGQRFLILSTNGVRNTNMVWKDTTLVQKGDTVEILIAMENPGIWMAHCHIAEHLESGMMFNFRVD